METEDIPKANPTPKFGRGETLWENANIFSDLVKFILLFEMLSEHKPQWATRLGRVKWESLYREYQS